MSSVAKPVDAIAPPSSKSRGVILVFCCTVLGVAAQVLMKTGANTLTQPGLVGMATNVPLMGGYLLYGISAALLVLALKDGELSLLYPVIALTYVWVSILSVLIFHERLNPFKVIGIATIVVGVCVLGRGGSGKR